MAFLRLFAGYGGDKQRLIKWAGGQAVGDGLSMSIGLGVGNDTRMTCDFFSLQTFNMAYPCSTLQIYKYFFGQIFLFCSISSNKIAGTNT